MTQINVDFRYSREKFAETFAEGRDHDCSGIGDDHRWCDVWGFRGRDGTGGDAGHGERATHRCRPLADPLPFSVSPNRRALPDDSRGLALASSSSAGAGRRKLSPPMRFSVLRLLADGQRRGGRPARISAFICLPAGGYSPSQGSSMNAVSGQGR